MMNARKQERYVPSTIIQAINIINEEPLGTLANISLGGFLLTSEVDDIPENAIFQLRIQVGNNQSAVNTIDLGAVCLWHSEASSPGAYWSGFQIIDISPQNEKALRAYVDTLHS